MSKFRPNDLRFTIYDLRAGRHHRRIRNLFQRKRHFSFLAAIDEDVELVDAGFLEDRIFKDHHKVHRGGSGDVGRNSNDAVCPLQGFALRIHQIDHDLPLLADVGAGREDSDRQLKVRVTGREAAGSDPVVDSYDAEFVFLRGRRIVGKQRKGNVHGEIGYRCFGEP